MTPKEAKAAVEKHGTEVAAARALGVSRSRIRWQLFKGGYAARPDGRGQAAPPFATKVNGRHKLGMTRADFVAAFDTDTRIRTSLRLGLATLIDNEQIIEDAEFRTERCRRAPSSGWRKISDEPEFAKHRFNVKGRYFWATIATVRWALNNVEGASQ